ncbi:MULTISPECIES: ATP-binding protein [unclassified Methylobacterium]|uniref:AlbA family DNA-binding domain-containing protein n=1 Tax=unclassified Methylobacterium TaxID=2615210 RepID=UPI0008F0C1C6|nr:MULTISPECIES: ATP-binding protein [unclassified Methylobacterium]SFV11729.1 Putative DNA-binding domain-containing protein [Methylobacterium sp. UNCCL125]
MRELYDRLIEEGEAGIDRLIAEETQESLQLDFKRKEIDRNGEFSTKDRQIFAQALSGFANSSGGLLIIGVDARQGPDRIDRAQAAYPVADIRRFLSEARTEIGQLVQPRLEAVNVTAIESSRTAGAGYLLVYIDRSERRPHRSEAKNQKSYFKRSGASFFEMEHYDIEDAFSRSGTAILEATFHPLTQWADQDEAHCILKVFLSNTGSVIAKFPYIVFQKIDGAILPLADNQPCKIQGGTRNYLAIGGSDDVIHPGTERFMAYLQVVIKKNPEGKWMFIPAKDGRLLSMDYLFGCESGRAMKGSSSTSPIAFDLYP